MYKYKRGMLNWGEVDKIQAEAAQNDARLTSCQPL